VKVGDRVRIERDETRWPAKGTWYELRGKVGTMIEINWDRKRPHLTEYGVVFGAIRAMPNGGIRAADGRDVTTWFHPWELSVIPAGRARAPVRPAAARPPVPAMAGAGGA
jgi:hypothetical protein